MRTDLDAFVPNMVLLLKDSSYVLVTDVDPVTKLNNSESIRRCHCKLGHKYKKDEQFREKGKYVCIIENSPEDIVISIDCSAIKTFTIAELRTKCACIVGVLTDEKLKDYNRINGDYSKTLDW